MCLNVQGIFLHDELQSLSRELSSVLEITQILRRFVKLCISCRHIPPEILGDATWNISQQCLNALAKVLPGLLGGSTDLASSNMTLLKTFIIFQKHTPGERNIRFGVREHRMRVMYNWIALYTPRLIPYCATFFVFIYYMRASMRLASLSQSRVIYEMTQDSIGLGEDGPTHQLVEHLSSFYAMPNIIMLRPADRSETAGGTVSLF
ncbi:hypothetical protein L2E82_18088 [Cichorium intybus]|uniref:Uncharacterized protein n=1 Tax=Cichorium intybus TaxID=13427 RepID=A0ACB9F9V0_CICIN|nr:hypothetical protein L2E82_18088 [Cichorium intybus]